MNIIYDSKYMKVVYRIITLKLKLVLAISNSSRMIGRVLI